MKKKDASFWSDIKSLDERLTREPDSFCFARLSEIYLKVGLVADALHTARTGVAKHPGYLAGLRALAMACNASGLQDESRGILEQVTAAMPEDVEAQKTLASLYVAAGDATSAIRTYRTVLDFRPDDKGSAIELEALQQVDSLHSNVYETSIPVETESVPVETEIEEDEIIELSECDVLEEPAEEVDVVSPPETEAEVTSAHHDPLSTLTLAELYEQQGFLSKALEIYRTILADDPANSQLLAKIAQLEGFEPVSDEIPVEAGAEDFEEETDLAEPVALAEETDLAEQSAFAEETDLDELTAFEDETDLDEQTAFEDETDLDEQTAFEAVPSTLESDLLESFPEKTFDVFESEDSATETNEDVSTQLESMAFAPLARQSADNVVDTLDTWLENIRRIKACR